MVKVDFGGTIATINNYVWDCNDNALLDLLNSILDNSGPTGSDPDPDYTAAQVAIDEIKFGEIVYAADVPFDDEVIY